MLAITRASCLASVLTAALARSSPPRAALNTASAVSGPVMPQSRARSTTASAPNDSSSIPRCGLPRGTSGSSRPMGR